MSADARSVSDPDRPSRWLVLLVGAYLLALFLRIGGTPFQSEDWTQITENRGIADLWSAIDPSREPLRPFQHAFLWWLAHAGLDPAGDTLPWLAHAVGFAMHVVSCVLVFRLTRLAGLRGDAAMVACALFAAFPNVKSVAWSAAVGNPARVVFELAALLAFVAHVRAPSWRTGLAGLLAFAASLTGHESAMLLPGVLGAWIVFVEGRDLRDGVRRILKALRDPYLLALALAAAVYVVHLATRTQRHHRVKSFDALPANVVKASTSLLPEFARAWIVDGFRGSGAAFGVACVLFAALAIGVLIVFVRSRFGRFVLAAVGAELGLAVLGAGFVQRYAYLSSAFVALGLAVWVSRGGRARASLATAIGLAWCVDAWVDAGDFARVRSIRDRCLAQVVAAREAVGPDGRVVIVNPPDMIGAERDIPLFNWGIDDQLRAHGVASSVLLWRTRPYATSTVVELVDPARVEEARRSDRTRVVDGDLLAQP